MDANKMPWIEKYRPKNLNEMIDHSEKITTLRNLIKNNELPHLLLYGPPGTGKTSLILAAAREMYGADYRMYILELNASDDRGIDIVRTKIPNFVRTKSDKLRLVILDEADAMTQDAQSALRRVMELYIKTSRFCLICNNFNKIISGVKSRCSIMRFGLLNQGEMETKVNEIVAKENMRITPEAIRTLINMQKDFRQILNTLQCLHYIRAIDDGVEKDMINKDDIFAYLGKPTDTETRVIIDQMFCGSFQEVYDRLLVVFRENRWNPIDLIHMVGQNLLTRDIKDSQKFYLYSKLSQIEFRLSCGRDSEIQLAALVSAFQKAKTK